MNITTHCHPRLDRGSRAYPLSERVSLDPRTAAGVDGEKMSIEVKNIKKNFAAFFAALLLFAFCNSLKAEELSIDIVFSNITLKLVDSAPQQHGSQYLVLLNEKGNEIRKIQIVQNGSDYRAHGLRQVMALGNIQIIQATGNDGDLADFSDIFVWNTISNALTKLLTIENFEVDFSVNKKSYLEIKIFDDNSAEWPTFSLFSKNIDPECKKMITTLQSLESATQSIEVEDRRRQFLSKPFHFFFDLNDLSNIKATCRQD